METNPTCEYGRIGPACDRPSRSLGFCSAHYQKLWRIGHPLLIEARVRQAKAVPMVCRAVAVDGSSCHQMTGSPSGLCTKHHYRKATHGDVRIAQVWAVGETVVTTVTAWEMRQLAAAGTDIGSIAVRYNLPNGYVAALVAGRGWKKV